MTVCDAESHLNGIMCRYFSRSAAIFKAAYIIRHITGTSIRDRIGDRTTTLSQDQKKTFDKYVAELNAGKPIEYVLNEAIFYGQNFYVDENVTIPGGDTTRMVKWALESFLFEDSNPDYKEKELSIIDIGTGCGCIAITLKKHLPRARIYAIEESEKALQVAKRNAKNNDVEIDFLHMDLFDWREWDKLPKMDLVICNPPYVPARDQDTLNKIARMYEPYKGLFLDHDNPLIFHVSLALFAHLKLKPKAFLFAEIHEIPGSELMNFYTSQGFGAYIYKTDILRADVVIRVYKDYSGE